MCGLFPLVDASKTSKLTTADGRKAYRSGVRNEKLDSQGYVWLQRELKPDLRNNAKIEEKYGSDYGEGIYKPGKAPIINGQQGTPAQSGYVAPAFQATAAAPAVEKGLAGLFTAPRRLDTQVESSTRGRGWRTIGG